jgi:hypothetical protein
MGLSLEIFGLHPIFKASKSSVSHTRILWEGPLRISFKDVFCPDFSSKTFFKMRSVFWVKMAMGAPE